MHLHVYAQLLQQWIDECHVPDECFGAHSFSLLYILFDPVHIMLVRADNQTCSRWDGSRLCVCWETELRSTSILPWIFVHTALMCHADMHFSEGSIVNVPAVLCTVRPDQVFIHCCSHFIFCFDFLGLSCIQKMWIGATTNKFGLAN